MTQALLPHPKTIQKIEFWRDLAPFFSVGGKLGHQAFEPPERTKMEAELVREGYLHLTQPGLRFAYEEAARLIVHLVSLGLPPVFFFVYDAAWSLSRQLRHLLNNLLEDQAILLPDFWAWCVAPGQSGWRPHRDRSGSLYPDRRPKSLTVWLPITPAHPLNSCMYALPASRDPDYVSAAQNPAPSLADIRALPAEPGDVLLWTQHLYHWGGHAADDHSLPPRMSLAFEFQRKDLSPFNEPLLPLESALSFEQRLSLIGKQVLQYRHMYGFEEPLVHLARSLSTKSGSVADVVVDR